MSAQVQKKSGQKIGYSPKSGQSHFWGNRKSDKDCFGKNPSTLLYIGAEGLMYLRDGSLANEVGIVVDEFKNAVVVFGIGIAYAT